MADFINILTHERRLRANTKELSVEELKEVQVKLARIVTVREEEEEDLRREEAEKRQKVEAFRKQMKEAGLDFNDLAPEFANQVASPTKAAPRKRTPKPAKYTYSVDGEERTWTGQGRTPKVIQQALDKGKQLKDFLIK